MAKAKLSRALWVLYVGTFINRFGTFVSVFLILYMTSRGFTAAQAGIAASFYGLGSVASSAVGGYCADRLGRRKTIMLSMFSSASTMLTLSQAASLPLIILLTTLAGLTTELYRPASSALIADLTTPEQRVTSYAFYRLAVNLGTTAGPIVAGLLASRSFLLIFIGDALTSICFGLLALFALPEGTHKQQTQAKVEAGFLQTLRRDRRFLFFLLAATGITFVYFQQLSTFPLQIRDLGFSSVVYGTLLSINALVIVLVELPISTITRRSSARPVIALGWLLIGLGFGLNAFVHTIPLLALGVLIWTFGEMSSAPVSAAYVANIAPPHLQGRYQGTWGLVWGLGLILAPLLGTLIYSWNGRGLWLLCGTIGFLAALILLLTGREQQPIPALAEISEKGSLSPGREEISHPE